MNVDIRFNIDQVIKDLDDVAKKQMPFALALTLNRTAEERQALWRRRIASQLIIRSSQSKHLFERAVNFSREDRADKGKGRFTATIRILGGNTKVGPGLMGFRRIGQMIIRQDEGGTRSSDQVFRAGKELFVGGHFIPFKGLRTNSSDIPRRMYPANIGAALRRDPGGKTYFAKSKRRVFAGGGFAVARRSESFYTIKGVGIFHRTADFGASDKSQPIWWFRRSINLPARLQLDRTFHDGLDAQLQANFQGFLTFALRTAKR